MLEAYLATKPDPQNPNLPLLYFFARVAQLHPAANRGYEVLFDHGSAVEQALLLTILELSADEKTVEFLRSKLKDKRCQALWTEIAQALQKGLPLKVTVLLRPVGDSVDMDLRWAEFSVTGNPEVVVPIMDVLEWPDLLRQKLDDWLNARLGPAPTTDDREQVRRRLFEAAGISLDLERNRVKTPEDLDYVSVLADGRVAGERLQKVVGALTFPISNEEKQRIVGKAVAKWSLESNAMQHAAILALCEDQAARRTGRAKLALLEIVGRTWSAREDYERAAGSLRSYLEISPENKDIQRLLEVATAKMQLIELGNLSKESAVKETGDIPPDLVAKAAAVTREARSYLSKTLLQFHAGGEEGNIEWQAAFVSPDNYHVQQAGWGADREKAEFDEWITLGRDHYDNVGVWVRLPESSRKQRMELNPLLRVGKFLGIMTNVQPTGTGIFHFHQRRYLMLEYQGEIPPEFRLLEPAVGRPARFRIWIDWEHKQVAKGELDVELLQSNGKRSSFRMQEVFAGYGVQFPIAPPQQVLEAAAPK